MASTASSCRPVTHRPSLQRMARFADSPDLIASMGAASRARAEARYDVHGVNRTIFDALDL